MTQAEHPQTVEDRPEIRAMARALCQVRHGSEGTNSCVARDRELHEAEGLVGALDWLTGYRLVNTRATR